MFEQTIPYKVVLSHNYGDDFLFCFSLCFLQIDKGFGQQQGNMFFDCTLDRNCICVKSDYVYKIYRIQHALCVGLQQILHVFLTAAT